MAVTLHLEWRLFLAEIDLAVVSRLTISRIEAGVWGCPINSMDFLSSTDSSGIIGNFFIVSKSIAVPNKSRIVG